MKRWIVLGLLALLALAWVIGMPRVRAMGDVGAGYVAKQMCSCVFVGGRSFDACRPDMLPDMDRISAEVLSADAAAGSGPGVRAWIPFLVDRVARHREGSGCTLEP